MHARPRAPRAKGQTPAATAAAQPLEEPPQKRAGSCGLRAVPCGGFFRGFGALGAWARQTNAQQS